MSEITVPYVNLVLQHQMLKPQLLAAVERVLDHGQFILGPEVEEFEKRFATYCGASYAVGVDNGTSALYLVLRALGIGSGDEVITTPNSFLASASCVTLVDAHPKFVDVGDDFNMDPNLLEDAITPQTRAIIPVHLSGRPADMHPIMEIARRHNLFVIEDCAQAVGARYHGQHVGTFGHAGCFSLHPLKTLSAVGDAGVIVSNDRALTDQLRIARNHGLRNRDECEFWSYNARLDTLQAAMLLVKFDCLDQWTEARRASAVFYREQLKDIVQVPQDRPHEYSVYHTFIVQAERRNELQRHLLEHGVDTKIHYPIPIHLQNAAKEWGYGAGDFPTTERQVRHILSLPMYPEITDAQLETVVSSIRTFYL